MKEGDAPTSQALRALCQLAGDQAAGWRPEGDPGRRMAAAADLGVARRRQPLLKSAAFGLCGLLTLAVVAARFAGEGAPDAAPALSAVPRVQVAPALPSGRDIALQPQPVEWHSGELRIHFDAVPLPQAIALLAHASHTRVSGAQSLQPVPVTLRLRTGDPASAWRHLLQDHTGFSVSCGASDCQLRIGSSSALPAAAAASAAATQLRSADTSPAEPAPSHTESQPDGSC